MRIGRGPIVSIDVQIAQSSIIGAGPTHKKTNGLIYMYLKYQIGKCYLICSNTVNVNRNHNSNYSAYELNDVKKIGVQATFPLEVPFTENMTQSPFSALIACSSAMGSQVPRG